MLPGPPPTNVIERKAVLREVFGDGGWECPQILAGMDHVRDVYFDRVSQIRMDRWSSGRVMLIGDAAACVSLLAGEGTGLAMTEAYVLAGELRRTGGDFEAAFQSHERMLRGFIASKQQSALRLASSFAPRSHISIWLRNMALRLLKFPLIARMLVGRNLTDGLDLPEYPAPEESNCARQRGVESANW
jgi:2-polyprenyl-6-methoxyphenol hydroxylase-like FAD-dependent oxidoreductase